MNAAALAPAPAAPAAAGMDGARQRLTLCLLLFVALTAALAFRLADLALFDTTPSGAATAAEHPRADLTDRRGVVLAHRYEAFALVVRPRQLVGDPATLAPAIAAAAGLDPARVLAQLKHPATFRYVARRVPAAVAARVNALGEPGIEIQREPDRLYPQVKLASHVLGFTGVDGRGEAGMERALDARLKADGPPPALSIDARVQQALEHELAAGMAKHSAIGAAGVVLDVATGEVLAMASLPSFNPNDPGRASADSRFNRATLGVYELGSTFKLLTVAMALDTGATRITDRYDASRPLRVAGFPIRDYRGKHRVLSVPEVIIYSSNIGTARIAERVGATRQRDYLGRLGLLAAAEIELGERGRTIYPQQWGQLATMTVGYGHGIAVSPLHLASAYAALVNGGIYRPATLVKLAPGDAPEGRRVFTQATSDRVRQLMRLVVLKGSGRKADAPGYRLGGKTGTADKPRAGGYNRNNRVATFAGAFPIDAPRYVVVAMLDEPKPTNDTFGFATAGWVSAPIVAKLVPRIGPMLGVVPDAERDLDVSGLLPGDDVKIVE